MVRFAPALSVASSSVTLPEGFVASHGSSARGVQIRPNWLWAFYAAASKDGTFAAIARQLGTSICTPNEVRYC